jgi:hypothetical protein
MKRWIGALLCTAAIFSADAEDFPLPTHDGEEPGEIEPPLLIMSRARDGSIPDQPGVTREAPPADVAKLETDLIRAQKRAAGADRMYNAGIIAKVDAEQRVLKVVQLEAALAQARLDAAKAKAESTGDAATDAQVRPLSKQPGARLKNVGTQSSTPLCGTCSGSKSSSPWAAGERRT